MSACAPASWAYPTPPSPSRIFTSAFCLTWAGLTTPEVLTLRYEDFLANRAEALGQVYDHAVLRGLPAQASRDEAIQILEASIDPERSPTFRSGKAGGWRTQFSPENKQLFKDTVGDLLIQLGYEHDHDW